MSIYLSIIIPVYNEKDNLSKLYQSLNQVLVNLGKNYEIIFIDDGSRDGSQEILKELAAKDPKLKIISFKKNFGQTAALAAGINNSLGEIIIPLDADLQNDPRDISKLLEKVEQGYDVVSGWRKKRKDKFFTKILPSWLANILISFITGVKLHDYGCTLKAYRRVAVKDIHLYGEMHRFIPAYAAWYGARVTEIEVTHHARKFGQSKYGLSRTFRVILDLLTVKFLSDYSTRPIHFFGGVGFISSFLGLLSGLVAIYLRFFQGVHLNRTPLPLLAALFIIVGIQFILMGLLAEIIMRTYHESQQKPIYLIKEKINF